MSAGHGDWCRWRGNTHERHAHGRIAFSVHQRQTVVPEIWQTMPRATASRASSAADHREIDRPEMAGSSHASALTSAISAGGKRPGTPRPGPLIKPGDAFGGEPLSPPAGRLVGAIQPPRDLGIAVTLGREHHDLGADHLAVRTRVLRRAPTQLTLLALTQPDRRSATADKIRRPYARNEDGVAAGTECGREDSNV